MDTNRPREIPLGHLVKGSAMNQCRLSFAFCLVALSIMSARADHVVEDQSDANRENKRPIIVFPYLFSTDALDTGVGAILFRKPIFQPQASLFVTAYGTSNSSLGLFGGFQNVRIGERLFFNATIGLMDNDQQRFYGDLAYDINSVPSGSNESDEDDFVFGSGVSQYVHLTFRYVLPIGAGKDKPVHRYITRDGLLVDGSTYQSSWDPRISGRTFVYARPFYQRRTLEVDAENIGSIPPQTGLVEGEEVDVSTNGLELGIEYDNRDFSPNPSQGSRIQLRVARDFGWLESYNSWTSLEFSVSKYWNMGETEHFAQRVFAAKVWTAYVPTRDTELVAPGIVHVRHRPPSNRGATLGGFERLRGYPSGRFNDKAAIYYGAELRVIPKWDPFRGWPIIRKMPWRWWQIVGFAEVGRVSPSWDFGELHEDLKWSAGVGVHIMIGGSVIRFDFAVSEESTQFWIMARQTF